MSSKSRYQKKSAKPEAELALPKDDEGEEQHLPTDDLFEVPRGRSKLQFYFLIFLLVFLLIVFIIPGAMMAVIGGGGSAPGDELVLAYDHPSKGRQELSYTEFITEKRALDRFRGLNGVRQGTIADEEVAKFLILEAMAESAGVSVSKAELADELRMTVEAVGGTEAYKAVIGANFRSEGGVLGYEEVVQREMVVRRLQMMLTTLAAHPDPDAIRERWAEEHIEFAFDYAEIGVDELKETAGEDVPADEELEAWFSDRTEFEKNRLKVPEKRAGLLATYRITDEVPAALLEAFPADEAEVAEERAKRYFQTVRRHRFAKPDEPEAADAEDDGPQFPEYYVFEDVEAEALAEYPVYFAMQRWRDELQSRAQDGEELDFATEVAEVGLTLQEETEPLTPDEWQALPDVGSQHLSSAVRVPEGSVAFFVAAAPNGFSVAFGGASIPAALPPFAEIREDVAEMWINEHVSELALDRMKDLAAALRPADEEEAAADDEATDDEADVDELDTTPEAWETFVVSQEDFAAAVEAKGLTLGLRDWLDRRGSVTEDPDATEPAHQFLRTNPAAFLLEEGQVGEPTLNPTKTHAYVVRSRGSREAPIDNMTPQQYRSYADSSAAMARMGLATQGLSYDELRLRYNVSLSMGGDSEELDEAEPAADDAGADS